MIFDIAACLFRETVTFNLDSKGPRDHHLNPCRCRVTTQTMRDLGGETLERGRGVAADGGIAFTDLHAFERDLLCSVRALERDGDAPKGLAIKSYLETEYREEINHSRLYQNLDQLVKRGLLEKGAKDDRTNEYATTDAGRQMLEHRAKRRADQLGLALDGGEELCQ